MAARRARWSRSSRTAPANIQHHGLRVEVVVTDSQGSVLASKRAEPKRLVQLHGGDLRCRDRKDDLVNGVNHGGALQERIHQHPADARTARPLSRRRPICAFCVLATGLGDKRIYTHFNSRPPPRCERSRQMQATATQAGPEEVRAFIQEYFDAWKGTDEDKILAYYSDNVVLDLPTGRLEGKAAVRDSFVRPFIAAFPGNVHAIRNLAHGKNLAAVEWSFEASHTGTFAGIEATGNQVQVPGCSFYEYDLGSRTIPAGRIYFNFDTLLRQIGTKA